MVEAAADPTFLCQRDSHADVRSTSSPQAAIGASDAICNDRLTRFETSLKRLKCANTGQSLAAGKRSQSTRHRYLSIEAFVQTQLTTASARLE